MKHDLFRRLARDRKSDLDKEETDRQYFRAKVDLARSLFDKQLAFNGTLLEVKIKIKIKYSKALIWVVTQRFVAISSLNVNRNLHKVVYI